MSSERSVGPPRGDPDFSARESAGYNIFSTDDYGLMDYEDVRDLYRQFKRRVKHNGNYGGGDRADGSTSGFDFLPNPSEWIDVPGDGAVVFSQKKKHFSQHKHRVDISATDRETGESLEDFVYHFLEGRQV